MNNKVAFPAQNLRAAASCTRQGQERDYEKATERTASVIVRYQSPKPDQYCPEITYEVQKKGSGSEASTNSQNAYEEVREPRITDNTVYQAWTQSRGSRQKSNYCKFNKIFIAIVLVLSVISMTASAFVGYLVIIEGVHCNCSVPNGSGTTSQPVKAVDHGDIKKKLNAKIMKLKGQLQEIQNDTRIQFSNWCKKTAKECQTELIDNLTAKLEKTLKKIELHLNKSKEGMKHKMEIARTKLNETTKVEKHVLEALIELNETISKQVKKVQMDFNLPADQCKLQRKKRTAKIDFLFVAVPYRSENRITVGVTCSTSIKNAPKTIYLTPPTEDDDDFKCWCHNDDNRKDIDCFAYYWQCKMS